VAERNPWTRRSRRVAYENDWIVVWHDEVTRPDGSEGIYGVVHPRFRAVGIVPIDDRDRVVLVGQYRYTLDRYSWEIPEGGVPLDEDPLIGARRELAEETGYRASTWRVVLEHSLTNSISDEVGIVFLATGLTPGEPSPEATEEIDVRLVALDEALAMIDRREIHDAVTQLGLFAVARERVRQRRTGRHGQE
jgi:8-oxo-dGTP pyrophosphatase MutT (NUDIX family)